MKAIVIGGSGATGKYLVEELLADKQYEQVVLLVRRKSFEDHPKLSQQIIDFNKIDEISLDADVAFSCLGTTLKLAGSKKNQWKVDYEYNYHFAKSAKQQGVPNFVLVSALGANASSILFYSKMKGKLEDDILSLNFNHTFIFRPSILIRPHSDRLGERISVSLFNFLEKFKLLGNYGSVPVRTLAKAMIAVIKEKNATKLNFLYVKEIKELARIQK